MRFSPTCESRDRQRVTQSPQRHPDQHEILEQESARLRAQYGQAGRMVRDALGHTGRSTIRRATTVRMSGQPLGDEARPSVEAMCERENRVVIRCRPYSTYATPPRHLDRNDQVEQLTHWVSGVVAWDTADPSRFTALRTDHAAWPTSLRCPLRWPLRRPSARSTSACF